MQLEKQKFVVERYISTVNNQDPNSLREIFASDAQMEDPIGSPPIVGIDAISDFFANGAFSLKARLHPNGEVRCAGNSAALPFMATLKNEDGTVSRINVINVFEFNHQHQIQHLRAYWGPDNHSIS